MSGQAGASIPFQIAEVAGILGLKPTFRRDSSADYPCPFCGDQKAHLNIHYRKNVFRCARCGVSGGRLDLYANLTGLTTRDAYAEILKAMNGGAGREVRRVIPIVAEKKVVLRAPAEVLDHTYRALLERLTLSPEHRESLLNRGLNQSAIEAGGYRSIPVSRKQQIVSALLEQRCQLKGIPGFYLGSDGEWQLDIRATGIMIPVCTASGLIEAIQIRRDGQTSRKYLNLTSTDRPEGIQAAVPAHFVGVTAGMTSVYLTEGPLKANVAHHIALSMGKSIGLVALAGVNNTNALIGTFEALKRLGVHTIVEAFDMDKATNEHVKKGVKKATSLALEAGFQVQPLLWNPEYKGIDDFLFAVRKKRVYQGDTQLDERRQA